LSCFVRYYHLVFAFFLVWGWYAHPDLMIEGEWKGNAVAWRVVSW
jgi:hypothetical protein